MKRTNVALDETLLEEAVRLSGGRTYSRTIERALIEMVRRVKAGQIELLAGSGWWAGDLGVMRQDLPLARESGAIYRTKRRRAAR